MLTDCILDYLGRGWKLVEVGFYKLNFAFVYGLNGAEYRKIMEGIDR